MRFLVHKQFIPYYFSTSSPTTNLLFFWNKITKTFRTTYVFVQRAPKKTESETD